MKFVKEISLKTIAIFVSPLLLFVVLAYPYEWVNQNYLVEIFGCGCPKVDEYGNVLISYFNANDFTRLFWLGVTLFATVIAVFLSKRITKESYFYKVLYVVGVFLASLLMTYWICQMSMWS